MSKPDDIPQDVDDRASFILSELMGDWTGDWTEENREVIARAILAEREACAAMFEKHPFHHVVAAAIRNRGATP